MFHNLFGLIAVLAAIATLFKTIKAAVEAYKAILSVYKSHLEIQELRAKMKDRDSLIVKASKAAMDTAVKTYKNTKIVNPTDFMHPQMSALSHSSWIFSPLLLLVVFLILWIISK